MLIPIMYGNNIRGREGAVCVCVRGGEQGGRGRGRADVENVFKAGSALWFFPLPVEMTLTVIWTKSSVRTQHEDMMLKQNKISLADLDSAVAQLF